MDTLALKPLKTIFWANKKEVAFLPGDFSNETFLFLWSKEGAYFFFVAVFFFAAGFLAAATLGAATAFLAAAGSAKSMA